MRKGASKARPLSRPRAGTGSCMLNMSSNPGSQTLEFPCPDTRRFGHGKAYVLIGVVVAQSPSKSVEFRRIFDDHFVEVQRYCARRLSPEDANDAVSEVFLVAWRRLDAVPQDEGALPWLIAVARNAVRNARRSQRRAGRLQVRAKQVDDQAIPGPEVLVVQSAEYREVAGALLSLSDDDQEVIRLRAWEELTAPEIAVVLDISLSAAEKRVGRAMARLERAVAKRQKIRPRAIEKGGDA